MASALLFFRSKSDLWFRLFSYFKERHSYRTYQSAESFKEALSLTTLYMVMQLHNVCYFSKVFSYFHCVYKPSKLFFWYSIKDATALGLARVDLATLWGFLMDLWSSTVTIRHNGHLSTLKFAPVMVPHLWPPWRRVVAQTLCSCREISEVLAEQQGGVHVTYCRPTL